MVSSSYDVKTLDVRIMELKEDADNVELLLTILSMVIQEFPHIEQPIKDLDLVNYVLANALKIDKVPADSLGLVMMYLERVDAPSIYFQYAILRVH
jgi:hypothetical protein